MKRIWFGTALLVILLILGLGTGALMERTHMGQSKDMVRAAELALEGNWAGAENFAAAARREWSKHQLFTAVLVDHERIDQIESLFVQLEVFAKAEDAGAYSSTCMLLAHQLEALGESHGFNLKNFL